ncbi:hypothetical protein LBMAG33_6280 [Candidatus Levyibacteriota bacterium]|nr:methionine--tRNA ligase [Candidatus Levybacteria bacterium]GDX62318.1 hypothetical protein LBMAG33_6280 [Candidatus Levybacteria bacterium]
MSKYLITSAIPYVNAKPHIGWALEIIQADTIARYQRLIGNEVFYLCGSDENSLKNVQAAEQSGETIKKFIDENAKIFEEVARELSIVFDVFQKGSNPNHYLSSQKLWQLCQENGDIYKKSYTGLYCVGCELFYEKEELDKNGECLEHPGKIIEEISEENYFFALSKYQDKILNLIESEKLKIIPDERKNEALSFIKQGLKDISISRSNARAKNWGVTVPGDETQKMYVWFDALNIYQSGIGFGFNHELYKKWWPADLHAIGKGILRFHAIYWPAFLLSAKLSLPKKLFVHEYITINGQKMSKSLGNIINPLDLIKKYGSDSIRYYFLRYISPFSDGDFSEEKLKETYNADLANGLGNLVSRVAKLCENNNLIAPVISSNDIIIEKDLDEFHFNAVLEDIWQDIKKIDIQINIDKPWKLSQEDVLIKLQKYIKDIIHIASRLRPFLPETAEKIQEQFQNKIKATIPLFPRL